MDKNKTKQNKQKKYHKRNDATLPKNRYFRFELNVSEKGAFSEQVTKVTRPKWYYPCPMLTPTHVTELPKLKKRTNPKQHNQHHQRKPTMKNIHTSSPTGEKRFQSLLRSLHGMPFPHEFEKMSLKNAPSQTPFCFVRHAFFPPSERGTFYFFFSLLWRAVCVGSLRRI